MQHPGPNRTGVSGACPASAPLRRHRRTLRLTAVLVLCATAAVAQAQDRAYVDSPAGRSVVDPARADGGSVVAGTVFVRPANAQGGMGGMGPVMDMQIQMAGLAMANAQRAAQAEAAGGGAAGQAGGLGGMPGAGAGPGGMAQGMPQGGPGGQPSPMQQIGSGLIQDAGGVVDANLRRNYGGNVVLPPSGGGGGW